MREERTRKPGTGRAPDAPTRSRATLVPSEQVTEPVAATFVLSTLLRRTLAVGAATLVLGGGARLAVDEVRLVGVTSEATHLRGRLDQQATEAQRAARLELDLAVLREEGRALAAARADADRRLDDLERSSETARAEVAALEVARDRAAAIASESAAAATEAAARARALDEQLAAARAYLDVRAGELEEARELAIAQATRAEDLSLELSTTIAALDVARAREASLEGELEGERRVARERAAALVGLNGRLVEVEATLAQTQARARRETERLERLARAGVNVARLTGERPMPEVKALVVQVDADAVPPTVVLDAGEAAGLERGDVLIVLRDGQELARLEVDEVRGPYSSARVVRGQRGARVRPGDQVRSRTAGGPP